MLTKATWPSIFVVTPLARAAAATIPVGSSSVWVSGLSTDLMTSGAS